MVHINVCITCLVQPMCCSALHMVAMYAVMKSYSFTQVDSFTGSNKLQQQQLFKIAKELDRPVALSNSLHITCALKHSLASSNCPFRQA